LPELNSWLQIKRAIKARFLRFYRKPTAFEAIEPDIAAFRIVSALHLDQGANAFPKWEYRLQFSAKKIGCH